jgi:hypothetical protein
VWSLVEWRNLGLSDDEILEQHPDLSHADLQVAWEYYGQHRDEIDQAIRENEDLTAQSSTPLLDDQLIRITRPHRP